MDYPFTTDGCSGLTFWLWRKLLKRPPPWEGHCVEHDRAYHAGGSREQRRHADLELAAAVCRMGYPIMGALMYYGVRVGGVWWLPTPWRWGYGWRWPRRYVKAR